MMHTPAATESSRHRGRLAGDGPPVPGLDQRDV